MNTILTPLRRAHMVAPQGTATVDGPLRLTYAQLEDRCRRLAGALHQLGLRRGDRVAVAAVNSHRYLELYLAIPAAGLVLVPLNRRHSEAELRYALTDSGARLLFTDLETDGLEATVEQLIALPDGYEDLLASATPIPDWPHDVTENDLAGLFYTGGTTGTSKGVMLSHRALVSNAFHFMSYWPFSPRTRWLVAAPMFHAAGTIGVLATVWQAGTHVFLPAFAPAEALDLVEREGVTHTLVVPTMLAAMADEQSARPRDVSSLRYLSHGGSPAAADTLHRTHRAFPEAQMLHAYGATETAPIATMLPNEDRVLDGPLIASCGQPSIGVEVDVAGPEGVTLPAGEVGEVRIKGPNVMSGYWNKPAETAAALVGGWYLSGDLGRFDADGYLYLVDRAKDMVVSGGENVYSIEVEDALYGHPSVLEAAVFGVPDERWGEAVHAVVVPRDEAVTPDELIAHCRELIAGYKVPKIVELRAEPLPKSGAGKILKRELRHPHWLGRTVQV